MDRAGGELPACALMYFYTRSANDVCVRRTTSFVEFETAPDLRIAVDRLDGQEFKPGCPVGCTADVCGRHFLSFHSISFDFISFYFIPFFFLFFPFILSFFPSFY